MSLTVDEVVERARADGIRPVHSARAHVAGRAFRAGLG
jgi:hypothetical protein